jgi:hypothetical protein
MAAKFVLRQGSTGKFHFNLVAPNGQVIASSESYEQGRCAQRDRVGQAQRPDRRDRRPGRQVARPSGNHMGQPREGDEIGEPCLLRPGPAPQRPSLGEGMHPGARGRRRRPRLPGGP